jgi:hypothetical protein
MTGDRATALRRAFDESFAAAPIERELTEDFLAIRVAGEPFAFRMTDIARVAEAPKIVGVPSVRASVLGVAAIRGALVSVHSLAALLGYANASSRHAWIALLQGVEATSVAFDALDGFVRAPRGKLDVLRSGEVSRPIVDIGKVIASIRSQ